MEFMFAAQQLEEQRFVVLDQFLNIAEISRIIEDFDEKKGTGRFTPAGIGKGSDHHLNQRIRNDETFWFEPSSLNEPQKTLWQKLEKLKEELNRHFFAGLWDLEGHYAWYPPGGKYDAHLDRFSKDDARTISMVLYLNRDWKKSDGGELRIHREQLALPSLDIEPVAGRLVCFFSAEVLHEVLPSQKPRMSFAGWWKRRTANPI
jgi:SM-20-related protein